MKMTPWSALPSAAKESRKERAKTKEGMKKEKATAQDNIERTGLPPTLEREESENLEGSRQAQ